jgi:hypothetical protein
MGSHDTAATASLGGFGCSGLSKEQQKRNAALREVVQGEFKGVAHPISMCPFHGPNCWSRVPK